MRKTSSILLGSGFSVPEGLPTVGQLNKRMNQISEEEIMIHTDMSAMFLNGQKDLNRHNRRDERLFVQEFLKYYEVEILKGKEFHYETFYDFYSLFLHDNKNVAEIETFCRWFAEQHMNGKELTNPLNRISQFNRTYNQLLASQLHLPRYFNNIGLMGYGNYGGFTGYVRELLKTHDIKVHTLNHDLFFEWLGHNHSDLFEHFSDGFELEGSSFYGTLSQVKEVPGERINLNYRVKVSRYTGRFDTPLTLFKLHGSIFNTKVHTDDGRTIRIRPDYGVDDFMMEIVDKKSGKWSFVRLMDEVDPDFLSGTTNKVRFYKGDQFYKELFDHFIKNLQTSDSLLVIGYGFGDPGINDLLEKHFLSYGKPMIVIDPNRPQSELLEKYNSKHIGTGITNIPYEFFVQLLPCGK